MEVKNRAVIAMNMILLLMKTISMKTTTMMRKKTMKTTKTRTIMVTVTMKVKPTVALSRRKRTASTNPTARKKVIPTKTTR